MAFVTDSNRPQPLWQPPPTACLTAAGAASEGPSLLTHPWARDSATRPRPSGPLFPPTWGPRDGGGYAAVVLPPPPPPSSGVPRRRGCWGQRPPPPDVAPLPPPPLRKAQGHGGPAGQSPAGPGITVGRLAACAVGRRQHHHRTSKTCDGQSTPPPPPIANLQPNRRQLTWYSECREEGTLALTPSH